MYIDNSWYGHKKIILDYLNLKNQTLFASIQHGWLLEERAKITKYGKRKFTLAPFLCWNENIKNIIEKNKILNVYAIGAPFLYLCEINKKLIEKKRSNIGTLAFPFHSTHEEKITFDHEAFINKIENYFTPPFSVSLYNEDLNTNITSLYKNKNWRIVTFGKRENIDFMEKFLFEVIKYKTIVFSEVSTGFFYSMFLQKETKIIYSYNLNKEIYFFRNYINNSFNKKKINEHYLNSYPFVDKVEYNINKGIELAKKELGFESMKSQNELRKILKIDNKFIKILSHIFKILVIIKSKI
tara:strand:- start:1243 stop:2133 length:891 start_codon:yes stop_codon:yes gene_type:complete